MNPEQAAEIQAMTAQLVVVNGSTYRAVHPDLLAALIKRRDELQRLVFVHEQDSARLDWLQAQTRSHWACHAMPSGRVVCRTTPVAEDAHPTLRGAIDTARGVYPS